MTSICGYIVYNVCIVHPFSPLFLHWCTQSIYFVTFSSQNLLTFLKLFLASIKELFGFNTLSMSSDMTFHNIFFFKIYDEII